MLMMLAFGHTTSPQSDDDDADDARLLNGAGSWQLLSEMQYFAMLAAWDFRMQAA